MTSKNKKIIRVATKLMSERGYHGASIQMIADRVGVTKSTIFHHFKNKEGILLAILEEVAPSLLGDLMQVAGDENLTGMEKLKEAIRFHLNLIAEKGHFFNVLVSESRHLSETNKAVYLGTQRAYVNRVEDFVKQMKNENKEYFTQLNTRIVTHAILGMCNWAVQWYRERGQLDVDDIADHFFRIIIDGKSVE